MKNIIIMLALMTGCVSIKTHEQMKAETYERGVRDGFKAAIRIIDNQETKEDAKWVLKSMLDLKKCQ